MATFPTLTQGPDVTSVKGGSATDPTLRTTFESGARGTRNRANVTPKVWECLWPELTAADKDALLDFEASSVGYGGAAFSWANTDPNDATTYQVTFAEPIEWSMVNQTPGSPQIRYRMKAVLEEVP